MKKNNVFKANAARIHKRMFVAAWFVLFLTISMMAESVVFSISATGSGETAKVLVDPEINYIPLLNETFTISVKIVNVTGLYAFEIQFTWNPELIRHVSHAVKVPVETCPGGVLHKGSLGIQELANELDENASMPWSEPGTRYWAGFSSKGEAESFSGSGTVFEMTFRVVGKGYCPLEILFSELSDKDAQPIYHEVTNGLFSTRDPANQFPFAMFDYYPAEPRAGEKVVFDASSSYDSDGRIVSYEWDWDGDSEYDDYSVTPTVEAWWIQDGTYNVGLKVVDDTGAESNVSKQVVVGASAISRISSMLAEWYDSLNFSQGLGQDVFETNQTNNILGIPSGWWRSGFKRFSLVDNWLRELDTGSKQLSWLKGTKFACLEVVDVIFILNIEIDHANAPGFTYQTWVLNAINEERLVHEAWKQSTPQYIYVMKPLFQYALGTIWSLTVSEQAILDLSLPLGIGVSTIRSGLRALNIKNVMKNIDKTAYSQALSAYFRWRWYYGDSPEEAWNDVLPSARLAVPYSANDGERTAILENMKWYFEQLWIKYEGALYYEYEGLMNQGLPLHLRREYREQVKNKLLSAMERYSYYLPNKKKCGIHNTPAELRISDSEGRITGVVDGVELEEIPNSIYDNETETATIFLPSNSLRYKVVGTGTGIYGLETTSIENGQIVNFTATHIPTSATQIHQYAINWTGLSQGEESVTVEVDSSGDGLIEYNFTSDNELNRTEYVAATTKHDIEIAGITTSKSVTGQGYNLLINATIMNYGVYTEVFNVTSYANTTLIESQTIVMASGSFTTITFTWNTTGFAKGNYTLWSYAEPVQGETFTSDNNSTDGWVTVTIPGDVDGDFENGHYDIDLFDAVRLLTCYGAKEGEPNFDPNCDIDNSGQVFLFDAVILLSQYGQKYP